jgi:hypothetical protein
MPSGLIKASQSDHLINSLIPATVALHLSAGSRQLGLLALFAWVVLQLLNRIRALVQKGATRETWLSWALLLGLFLFNVRNIVLRDDYRGSVLILLIGTGLLLGSQFSPRQWRNLLAWLAVGILPIALFFVIQLSLEGAWSIPANAYVCPEHLNASAMFCTYYKLVQPSMGSINRLATLLTFLTLAAWYSSTVARLRWSRATHLLLAATGYWIILRIDSRMAVLAVPFAIVLSWLGLRLRQRFSPRAWLLSLLLVLALLAVGAWEIILKTEVLSNTQRLRLTSCWIRKGMFRSSERFWMGSGYDSSGIGDACEFIRPGDPFGHAHNTIAQIAGNHGLLGLIGLIAFTALILHGLWRQLQPQQHRVEWSPWSSTEWGEISLGLNLALLFCALSTTVQEFSPVNQLLIGLVAGSACVARPGEFRPGMPENRKS